MWFGENGGDKDKDIKEIRKEEKNGTIKITIIVNSSLV